MIQTELKHKDKPKKLPKGKLFGPEDYFRHVRRMTVTRFEADSSRSTNMFHYVERKEVINADGRFTAYWECDCPGMQYFAKCWHSTEARKVYERDPEFKHNLTYENTNGNYMEDEYEF